MENPELKIFLLEICVARRTTVLCKWSKIWNCWWRFGKGEKKIIRGIEKCQLTSPCPQDHAGKRDRYFSPIQKISGCTATKRGLQHRGRSWADVYLKVISSSRRRKQTTKGITDRAQLPKSWTEEEPPSKSLRWQKNPKRTWSENKSTGRISRTTLGTAESWQLKWGWEGSACCELWWGRGQQRCYPEWNVQSRTGKGRGALERGIPPTATDSTLNNEREKRVAERA